MKLRKVKSDDPRGLRHRLVARSAHPIDTSGCQGAPSTMSSRTRRDDRSADAQDRLRVLQIVQQPALRGAEVFAKQLSSALRERGHEVRTVYLYASRDSRLRIEDDDVVLGASPRHVLERAFVQPRVVSRLMHLLDQFEPSVVQLNGGRAVKYGAALRHLRRRTNWVAIYRNIGDPEYWVRGLLKRFAYRVGVFSGVDGIVALSERSSEVFQNAFGVDAPIDVIPTAVSPGDLVPSESRARTRKRLETPEAAPVVLFVGNLAPEKRIDRLVSAFSRVHEKVPDARLWLVGEGPERSKVEALVRELGLQRVVSLIGQTTDVASYYAASDLFALTSDSEGIPAVVLEAAYFRLPVVATDVGLVRECVRDGESALLVRPDAAELGDALGRLVRDVDLRRRFGDCGRRLVDERFLISEIARRYEAFYRRVLAETRGERFRHRRSPFRV